MDSETKQIQYPQNFDIKLIVTSDHDINDTKKRISEILSKCKVVHSFVSVSASAKGNYYSYCYNIDIESKEHLEHTYDMLRELPGLKFAL